MPSADEESARAPAPTARILLGEIKAVFGTRGWLKIHSETRPRDAILGYHAWQIGRQHDWQRYVLTESRVQGPSLLVKLQDVDDREAAELLIGQRIAVLPDDLAPLPTGTYYWRDLVGLAVVNTDGVALGVVHSLIETGSNDVLCVRGDRERLIPFVTGLYVVDVDLPARRLTVDWQPDD